MSSTIYLTGSNIEPNEMVLVEPDWRTLAMSRLQRYGLTVLNPLELAWTRPDEDLKSDIGVQRALDLIDQCDALLANLTKSSYGTAMEIFYAHRRGKMVTVFGQVPFNPWVLTHSQARFADIEHALEYLIGEQPRIDPIAWAVQYEGVLSEHYEQFPPSGEPDYQFLGGELPVLVVAPHATASFKDGEFQDADAYSGAIAALLHKMSRNHSLINTYCSAADPLWHLETPMRRAFTDIVKSGNVALVIFLVGLPWYQAPGLHVKGFGPGFGTHGDNASRLRLYLSSIEPVGDSMTSCPLVEFSATELGIPTLVVGLHKRYRMPRMQPEQFARTMTVLDDFITEVGVELLRSNS